MIAADFFEVFQDTAIELIDLTEAGHLHIRPGLFAANASGAEHHDRFILQFFRQPRDAIRELAKMIEPHFDRVIESAKVILVVIPSIQQMNFATFVEPPLEFFRRKFGRCFLSWNNAVDSEGDDFLFDLHQHAIERLILVCAFLGLKVSEGEIRSEEIDEQMNGFRRTGDEKVDPFVTEQHGALQIQFACSPTNGGLPIFKVVQRDKLVAGDINDRRFRLRRRGWGSRCRHRLDHRDSSKIPGESVFRAFSCSIP